MGKNITYKGVTKQLDYYKGLPWDRPLTPKMKQFEKETNKNPVFRGVVTGTFEYWLYWKNTKKTHKKQSKTQSKTQVNKILNEKIKKIIITKKPRQFIKNNKKQETYLKIMCSLPTETIILLGKEVTYNWKKGQLYVDNKSICKPYANYGRDMFKYSKVNNNISFDRFASYWTYNYDLAVKNNWNDFAKAIIKFAKELGIIIKPISN